VKVGLVGPSYQERSPQFDNQRTVNLFPVVDETQQGKEITALYGTPGLTTFATTTQGPVRGMFKSANDRVFMVYGTGLYECTDEAAITLRGTFLSSDGIVTIDENGIQLAICDGVDIYILTYSTNVFGRVTDADFPGAGSVTFIDGYFAFNDPDTGKLYISALYDGTAIDALDFITAESSPDDLVRVIRSNGQLWLVGVKTIEIWTNTGDNVFPFERSSARLEMGCIAPHSVVSVDNSLVWVGNDTNGTGIVFRASGFTPEPISTKAIELKIQALTEPENLIGYTYQQDGHLFYVLTGADLETTLVYDFTTQQWHERAYLNAEGEDEQHLGQCHIFAFNKHLIGSRLDGTVYEMKMDTYSDDGVSIRRKRIFTHIYNEGEPFTVNRLQVDFERGVGLATGQGSAPVAHLRISKDFGQSWGNELTASIGAMGVRLPSCSWRRLGTADAMTFEVTISDPVKVAICGAYIT
jgi:hypothetical protein